MSGFQRPTNAPSNYLGSWKCVGTTGAGKMKVVAAAVGEEGAFQRTFQRPSNAYQRPTPTPPIPPSPCGGRRASLGLGPAPLGRGMGS